MSILDELAVKDLFRGFLSNSVSKEELIRRASQPPLDIAQQHFANAIDAIERTLEKFRKSPVVTPATQTPQPTFTEYMESLGYKGDNLDTPDRMMVNGLIRQLLQEGMSMEEIQQEFKTLGTDVFAGQMSTQTASVMSQKMDARLAEIRAEKLRLTAAANNQAEEEQETETPGISMGLRPGGSGAKKSQGMAGPSPRI